MQTNRLMRFCLFVKNGPRSPLDPQSDLSGIWMGSKKGLSARTAQFNLSCRNQAREHALLDRLNGKIPTERETLTLTVLVSLNLVPFRLARMKSASAQSTPVDKNNQRWCTPHPHTTHCINITPVPDPTQQIPKDPCKTSGYAKRLQETWENHRDLADPGRACQTLESHEANWHTCN